MKRLLVAAIAVASLSGCATVERYIGPGWAERADKDPDDGFVLAESAWHALNAVDVMQSIHIANSPNCFREVGFPTAQLFGDHPSKEEFVVSGIIYSLGYRAISSWLETKEREQEDPDAKDNWRTGRIVWHALTLATKAFTVGRNHANGLRPFGEGC